MDYKLRRREYEYNESLFKNLGIDAKEVVGQDHVEIFGLTLDKIKVFCDNKFGSEDKTFDKIKCLIEAAKEEHMSIEEDQMAMERVRMSMLKIQKAEKERDPEERQRLILKQQKANKEIYVITEIINSMYKIDSIDSDEILSEILDKIKELPKEGQPIFTDVAILLRYVNALFKDKGSLIIKSEHKKYQSQVLNNKINWSDKNTKYAYIFSTTSSLLSIIRSISLFYCAIKLAHLSIIYPTVLSYFTFPFAAVCLFASIIVAYSVLKTLDLKNKCFTYADTSRYDALDTLGYVATIVGTSPIFMMDTTFAFIFMAIPVSLLLGVLANEIYERKVVDLVNAERKTDAEQKPIEVLSEDGPSSVVNDGSAFHVSAHGVV